MLRKKNFNIVQFKNESISDYSEYQQEPVSQSQFKIRKKKNKSQGNKNRNHAPLNDNSYNNQLREEEVNDSLNEERGKAFDQFRNPNGLHEYKER